MVKNHAYKMVPVAKCRLLERNPQHLTPKQMDALKASISKGGFVAPILVRPSGKLFEVISGNHRFMAAQELGYKEVPAVVAKLTDDEAKTLAVNLNLIHGEPTAEQLAPDDVLADIHLEGPLLDSVLAFDDVLAERLKTLDDIPGLDAETPKTEIEQCKCPKCGRRHIVLNKQKSADPTNTTEPSAS